MQRVTVATDAMHKDRTSHTAMQHPAAWSQSQREWVGGTVQPAPRVWGKGSFSQRAKSLLLQRAVWQMDLFQVFPAQRDPRINTSKTTSPCWSAKGERSRSRQQYWAGVLSPACRAATQTHTVDRAKNNSDISF